MPYNLYRNDDLEYVLELMPQRHGFPLSDPEIPIFTRASEGFKEYRSTTGPQVGDVGTLGSGSFMPFFNIFLAKDHPFNSKCPPSFIPCTSLPSTRVTEHYLPPDTEINTMRSVPFGPKPQGTNATYDAGAILKLPNGVRRVDAVDIEHIREYAIENAPLWIKEGYVSHTDIYLVTGADLTNSWDTFLQFGPRQLFYESRNDKGQLYHEAMTIMDGPRWHSSTAAVEGVSPEHHNQCIFLRGFRIGYRLSKLQKSLQKRILRRARELIPVGPFVQWDRPEWRPRPGTFRRFLYDSRRRVARLGPVYKIKYPPPFHPLTGVNQMLLSQNPFAFVVISHDEDWMSVMNEDDTVTPSPLTLIKRVQRNFEQVRYKDGVYLKPRLHHKLHITTSRALTLSHAPRVETNAEAEAITDDISPYLLASIAVSADVDAGLKNVAQAALNLMQATVRVEVYTREWTLLASRFISAIASMTCLLADESRTKDRVWDTTLSHIESLLDCAVSSVQNQAGSVPRSRLLSGATSLRDIIYFNTRLGRVLASLKLSKQAETSLSKLKTPADIDRTIDVVAKKLQS